MDHVPILMVLEFPICHPPAVPSLNFQEVDCEEFNDELTVRLVNVPRSEIIYTGKEFMTAVTEFTKAIQDTICAKVPQSRPSPYSKRWWSKELVMLKRVKNKLSSMSYKYRALIDHLSHEEHRKIRSQYSKAINEAKKEHWESFLEGLSYG